MSKLILVTADDPDALLRAAAAPFCSTRLHDLPLLAVRQGGLRDAVYEMAAASGSPGWLGRPVVVFNELPALFTGERASLDALERETVITRVLAESRLSTLGNPRARRTVAAAFDRLVGDFIAEGKSPDDLATGLAGVDVDAWGGRRNTDIRVVFAKYVEWLHDHKRSDGRDGLLAAARAIATAKPGELTGLRRPFEHAASPRSVDIYGLADLRRGWRLLLDALLASQAVDELRLYLPNGQGAEVRGWAEACGAEVRAAAPTRSVAAPLVALRGAVLSDETSQLEPTPALAVTAAPDLTRELEDVARTVKRLLVEGDEQGIRASARDIAIVARQSRPYLTRAAEIFERYGIPTYARLRHTLAEVPAVAAIMRVFQAAADEWTIRRLRELSDSPYFDARFDMSLMREAANGARPRGIQAWRDALAALSEKAGEDDDADRIARRRRRIEQAKAELEKFAAAVGPLDEVGPKAESWIDLTIRMLGGPAGDSAGFLGFADNVRRPPAPSAPKALRDAARVDAAAVRAVVQLLVSWRDAVMLAPERQPLDAEQWALELERALADDEISVRTGERGGVQLIEASASEGQSWVHVFVLGMSAGSFPAEPARDVLFDDGERQTLSELGLPVEPARVWRAREMALFRGLVNAPSKSLHLSYAYADASGTPQLPSSYLDDVIGRVAGDQARWVTTIPGSRVAPAADDAIWSGDEAMRLGASATREIARADVMASMLGAATADDANVAALAQLLHATAAERVRAKGRAADAEGVSRDELAHAWNGLIADASLLDHLRGEFGDRVWSATQLETYGRCPFSFFGKYVLRVDELEEDEEDELSARDAGSVKHEALARTYERMLAVDQENPLSFGNIDAACTIVAEEVRRAFDGIGVKGGEGVHAARARETTILLQAYVKWEIEENEKAKAPMRPAHMELSFGSGNGDAPPVTLASDGRRLRLRGRIDRVDELIPEVAAGYKYIVDHKSGGSALSPVGALQKAGALIQIELYLAALAQVLPDSKIWGGSYQLIRKHKAVAGLERCSMDKSGKFKELGTATQKQHDARIQEAATLALSLVDGVLAGHFAARVPDTAKCLNYCQFRNACREAKVAAW